MYTRACHLGADRDLLITKNYSQCIRTFKFLFHDLTTYATVIYLVNFFFLYPLVSPRIATTTSSRSVIQVSFEMSPRYTPALRIDA